MGERVAVSVETMRSAATEQSETAAKLHSFQWQRDDPGPPYILVVGIPLEGGQTRGYAERTDALASLMKQRLPVLALLSGARHSAALLPSGSLRTPGADPSAVALAEEAGVLLVVDGPLLTRAEVVEDYNRFLDCMDGLVRLVGGKSGTLCPAEAAAISALRTVPLSHCVGYVRKTIGPVLALPPGGTRPLLDALAAIRRGGKGSLARRLGIHRTGATYRLGRIRELTGFDPCSPQGRLCLLLGFDLYVLDLPSMPPPGPYGGWHTNVTGRRRRPRRSAAG